MRGFDYIAKSDTVYRNQFYFYTLSTKHYKLQLQILNLYCNKNTRYLEINSMIDMQDNYIQNYKIVLKSIFKI